MRGCTSGTGRFIACLAGAIAALGFSTASHAQCGGTMLATPSPASNLVVGQSTPSTAVFGPLGQPATINAVLVNLECQNAGGCGATPCTDDGDVLQYDGDDTIAGNTCGQTVSTGLGNGSTTTNQITFTFAAPINLAAGATCQFSFQVTILDNSNDATPNQITGTAQTDGLCSNGLPLSACGSYLISVVNPGIHLEKTVDPTEACEGTEVTYTYTVTNTGDVALAVSKTTGIVDDNGTPGANPPESDDDFNPTFDSGDTNGNDLLDTTETWIFTAMRTPPVGTTTNTAVVTGTYLTALGNVNVTDDDDAEVVINPTPSCEINDPVITNCEVSYTGKSDGCEPLTFKWTGPNGFEFTGAKLTLDASDLAGEYCLEVTDCNGCTSGGDGSDCCIDFVPPVAPSFDICAAVACPDGPQCGSTGNTLCSTAVTGGSGDYTFTWSLDNCSAGWEITANGDTPTVTYTAGTACPTDGTSCTFRLRVRDNVSGCETTRTRIVTCCCPPEGGQGRTPGFWKQNHHFGHWPAPFCAKDTCPCGPATSFCAAFEIDCNNICTAAKNAFNGKSLLTVLGQGGGGFQALGRHAVAALLNSAHDQVDYLYSTAQVKQMVQDAVASCSPSAAHQALAQQNELEGGPLGGQLYCNSALAGSSSFDKDLNNDGLITVNDLNMLVNNWGNPAIADVNHDGVVNNKDVAIMVYWIAQQ